MTVSAHLKHSNLPASRGQSSRHTLSIGLESVAISRYSGVELGQLIDDCAAMHGASLHMPVLRGADQMEDLP